MQENPMVSIVIPVYNGTNYMREAIDSALAQTYSNIEIIVVNDGSTDNTREIALSYGNRIRYFEKENGGVSTALNLGIREMKGKYFSWLSHDDVYYPDKIEVEIEALRESGDMEQGVHSGWELMTMPSGDSVPYNEIPTFASLDRKYYTLGTFAVTLGLISGCSLLIPKKLFEEFGGFDTSLRGVQDYVKWFQIFRGKRILFVDKVLVTSRMHEEQVTNRYCKFKEEESSLYSGIMDSLTQKDLDGSDLDEYQFLGLMIFRFRRSNFLFVAKRAAERLLDLDEPQNGEELRNDFANYLHRIGDGNIYIYCAGMWGKALMAALWMRGVVINGITDSSVEKKGENRFGIPFVNPGEIPKKALIIVAKSQPQEIKDKLVSSGYEKVIYCDGIMNRLLKVPVKKLRVKNYLCMNMSEV